MKRLMFAMTLVFASISSTIATAAEPAITYANAQKGSISDQEIEQFIDRVIADDMTVKEMRKFQAKLSKEQKQLADELFLEKVAKLPVPDDKSPVQPQEPGADEVSAAASCDPGAAPNCWQQPIEEIYLPPAGSTSGTFPEGWYTTTTTCDTDPDIDYVFAGRRDATNPDKLRWTSTSTRVTYAIELGNGTNINAYGLNLYEARLCLGDRTVSAAGGAANVRANLYTYYIP